MTKVAICQSNYIPWKGYFDLIHDVDVFIFYDHTQYTTRDWRNRNTIKTPDGLMWLSVPVGSKRNRRIDEVTISNHEWQGAHWKSINQYYQNAEYFSYYRSFFEEIYLKTQWTKLSELSQYLVKHIAKDFLQITTVFGNSTEYERTGQKQDAIFSMLESIGTSEYVSGPAAKAYLDEQQFINSSMKLTWKDYSGYPEYHQFFPPFRHDVSILDLLFHTGPEAPNYIWGWRKK